MLIKNFFRALKNETEQQNLVCNQVISHVLDKVLEFVPVDDVTFLCRMFQEDVRRFCSDQYASHVFQTLLNLALKYIQVDAHQLTYDDEMEEKSCNITDEQKALLKDFLVKTSKFIYNNLDTFMQETYASYVVRSILEVCSGIEVDAKLKSSQKNQTKHSLRVNEAQILTIPDEFNDLFRDMIRRFNQIPNIQNILYEESGSTVLQSALQISFLKEPELCSDLIDFIYNEGLKPIKKDYDHHTGNELHGVFFNNSTARLLEFIITCSNSEQQERIYADLFSGDLLNLVRHNIGNFTVQKLLSNWKSKTSFEAIFEEAVKTLKTSLECGHTGVILALVQGCRSLKQKESSCLNEVMKLLNCFEPENKQIKLATLIMYMVDFDKYEPAYENGHLPSTSLHGSLILQELLKFQKPIKVVRSILEMKDSDLIKLVCDPKCSHIVNSYVSSNTVGEKNREKLMYKLKGSYAMLACSKHGSWSIEALLEVANNAMKLKICRELVESESKLLDNNHGKIIHNKFYLKFLKRAKTSEEWFDFTESQTKKRGMFDDIINDIDEALSQPKKKKKKKNK